MKNKAYLSITRPSYGDGSRKISIRVRDGNSRRQFLELQIDYDKFTEALTGLSERECDMETGDLDKVGKVKETDVIEFPFTIELWRTRKEDAAEAAKAHMPDGWELSDSFSSKGSFFYKEGKGFARATIVRFNEVKNERE